MPFSLLTIRKHLKPLTWLLGLALLLSASPHLAQGLVLCIGEDHVEVEASGAQHHAGSEGAEKAPAALAATSSASFHDSSAACIDVPLRAARGNDLCHQATRSDQARADLLLPDVLLAAAALVFVGEPAAQEPPPAYPSPAAEANPSLHALSSVVLLI
jgi:hypothetical protein